MSDAPIGHNNPPTPVLSDIVTPKIIDEIISAELDREPISPEGGKIKSIRARDTELEDMCRRFLDKYPKIESDEADAIATEVLSVCGKFAGGSGRIENARVDLKQPVWDAGKAIDEAFGKYGLQLVVRPVTGAAKNKLRQAPFTLAEQINQRLAAYKDAVDARIRQEAADEVKRKADEAAMAEHLVSRGSSTVTMKDAINAAEAAEAAQAIVSAPAGALTRSRGSNFGSSSRRRVRTFTVVNAALVPRHLCVPSESLIREAIGVADGPVPDIPGVKIEDITDTNRR